jgi:hypothetical protein
VFDVKNDERAWRVGADGEETVGARLEKLRKHGWHILHALPIGRGDADIDHLVIGHGGVYTINTKNHPGKKIWIGKYAVQVNGQSVPHLRNSKTEAERVGRTLSAAVRFAVPVKPALVFLTGGLIPDVTIRQRPPDVLIFNKLNVVRAIKRAPKRLDQEQVQAIYEVARRCTTWTGSFRCTCGQVGN